MLCPADEEPANHHSYILNDHLNERGVKVGTRNIPHLTPDRVVVMGEKVTWQGDFYIQKVPGADHEYFTTVEKYRHGLRLGSNYLFPDLHDGTNTPQQVKGAIDPWDVPGP